MDQLVEVRNRCGREKIDAEYEPLIAGAIAALNGLLPGRIVDVRVCGSVARGEDELGRSDVDFVALVEGAFDEAEIRGELDELERALQRAYPVAGRVDLMVLPAGELPAFPRFVLSSDSVSVYGVDELSAQVQRWRRDELVRLVTLNAEAAVRDYCAWVRGLDQRADGDEMIRAHRVIGKDFLRCVRSLAIVRGGGYEQGIERMYRQAIGSIPELAGLTSELYGLFVGPVGGKHTLMQALDRVERELLPAVRKEIPGQWSEVGEDA